MYWTGSKIFKPCKGNWGVCKAVFSNRPFQGFDRRNDEKAAAYPVCRLPVYYIEGLNVFPNTGWMEASKGMQGMSFSTFGYADAPGYTFSRIGHTLIFLLGKTTGTRTTVSDSSHNVYYVKLYICANNSKALSCCLMLCQFGRKLSICAIKRALRWRSSKWVSSWTRRIKRCGHPNRDPLNVLVGI